MLSREEFEREVQCSFSSLVGFAIRESAPATRLREERRSDANVLQSEELWPRKFPACAKDAVQEALTGAWNARTQFAGGSSVSTWFHAILRRVTADVVRQERRQWDERNIVHKYIQPDRCWTRPKKQSGEPDDVIGVTNDVTTTTAVTTRRASRVFEAIDRSRVVPGIAVRAEQLERAAAHERRDAIERAMTDAGVPQDVRMAMRMFATGSTWAEIAEEIDLPPKTIQYEVERWFPKLAEHLRRFAEDFK